MALLNLSLEIQAAGSESSTVVDVLGCITYDMNGSLKTVNPRNDSMDTLCIMGVVRGKCSPT